MPDTFQILSENIHGFLPYEIGVKDSSIKEKSRVYLADCMDLLRQTPDKYYDLSLVDPPYGIGATATIGKGDKRSGREKQEKWGGKSWDNERPSAEYFKELVRVSKNQIIFGGNYFSDLLPASRCWIVWDKMQRVNQADAELAWASYKSSVRVYQYHCSKLQGFLNPNRFHPTEKPVSLYEWLYINYLPNGGRVIDTHGGSMSNLIAGIKAGNIEMTVFEIDTDYYKDAKIRVENFQAQGNLFGTSHNIIWH